MHRNLFRLLAAGLIAAAAACGGGDREASDAEAPVEGADAPSGVIVDDSLPPPATPPPTEKSLRLQRQLEEEARKAGLTREDRDRPAEATGGAVSGYDECMAQAAQEKEAENRRLMEDGCRLLPGAPKR